MIKQLLKYNTASSIYLNPEYLSLSSRKLSPSSSRSLCSLALQKTHNPIHTNVPPQFEAEAFT